MKILLTGGSSLSGYWFASALTAAGHHVIAPLRGRIDGYSGVRRERSMLLRGVADVIEGCPFGTEEFFALVRRERFDVLAQHATTTENYASQEFDIVNALFQNTRGASELLRIFRESGGRAVLLTGSVFEQDEGVGNAPMVAFSPYGLSKGLTAQVFRYWCNALDIPLGKFVIANAFGPYEEPRFCNYIIRSWLAGETPAVRNPRYVRDNVHVDLLAKLYVSFVERVATQTGFMKLNPSGYPESQQAFALRLARELGPRLGVATPINFAEQTDFPEPAVRINTDIPDISALGWSESAAWDAIAKYYQDIAKAP